jgi:hypothetical protein
MKMTDHELRAHCLRPEVNQLLWKGVEHWLENWADPEEARMTAHDCQLCTYFLHPQISTCHGCPIYELTGFHLCEGTPWRRAFDMQARPFEEQRPAIALEYRFLVCLALGDIEDASALTFNPEN